MKRRLIVLFDGTWNTRDDRTNVARMAEAIAKEGADGVPQEKWYDAGPGTNWYDRIRGGAFGFGVSDNIRDGYLWVADEWAKAEESELFVFGFSRGAYTARSLVGLIRKSGLLKDPGKELVEQAYALYRNKDVHPDSAEAAAFRAAYSREIRVKFIGVWDTVGSLGVPITGALIPWGRDHYQWHDTELSKIVEYAYHAWRWTNIGRIMTRPFGRSGNRRTRTLSSAGSSAPMRMWAAGTNTIDCTIFRCDGCKKKPRPVGWP